jgi:hypothetical protein
MKYFHFLILAICCGCNLLSAKIDDPIVGCWLIDEIHVYDASMKYVRDYGIRKTTCKQVLCFSQDSIYTNYDIGTVSFKLPNGQEDGKLGHIVTKCKYFIRDSLLVLEYRNMKHTIDKDTLRIFSGLIITRNGIKSYEEHVYTRYAGTLPKVNTFCE